MRSFYFLCFIWVFLGCNSVGEETPDEEWEEKTELYRRHTANEEYNKALPIAIELVQIAEKKFPQSFSLADAYNRLGLVYLNTKQYREAESYLKKSLALAKKLNSPSAAIHQNLALVYQETNRESLALDSIKEALRSYTAEPEVDSSSMYQAKVILVELLTTQQDYEQATEQLKEIAEYGLSSGDSSLIMTATSAYVWLNLHLGQYETAIQGAEKLLSYYKRNNDKQRYTNALSSIGGAYFGKQDYEKAIEYFKKSAEYKLTYFNDSAYIAVQLKNIALAHEKNNDSTTAQYYYKLYNRLRR